MIVITFSSLADPGTYSASVVNDEKLIPLGLLALSWRDSIVLLQLHLVITDHRKRKKICKEGLKIIWLNEKRSPFELKLFFLCLTVLLVVPQDLNAYQLQFIINLGVDIVGTLSFMSVTKTMIFEYFYWVRELWSPLYTTGVLP